MQTATRTHGVSRAQKFALAAFHEYAAANKLGVGLSQSQLQSTTTLGRGATRRSGEQVGSDPPNDCNAPNACVKWYMDVDPAHVRCPVPWPGATSPVALGKWRATIAIANKHFSDDQRNLLFVIVLWVFFVCEPMPQAEQHTRIAFSQFT
jgi:hypothetical protein